MARKSTCFTFYFRCGNGEFDFEIGWVWIALFIALAWWML